MQESEQITHMDSDNYHSGMRMRRSIEEERLGMRVPLQVMGFFHSPACHNDNELHVKLTLSFYSVS